MTNEEKYKTPKERNEAFRRFCKSVSDCSICPIGKVPMLRCPFAWLTLEAEEEKPLPCSFCGGEGVACYDEDLMGHIVFCLGCKSRSGSHKTKAEAIAAWNRRAK